MTLFSRQKILDNIQNLEEQLRIKNFRRREEDLILRKIGRLRSSLPVLEKYRQKLQEEYGLKSVRVQLVNDRNSNYDQLVKSQNRSKGVARQLVFVKKKILDAKSG